MTLQQFLNEKYLKLLKTISQREWEEIKQIAKQSNKKIAEIVYRNVYFTWANINDIDRATFTEALNNHYIKAVRVKYGYDKWYLTIKGLRDYNVI